METGTNKSTAKLMRVLECFSTRDRLLTVTEIAARTQLPRSTAHRAILSLKAIGLLDQDASREAYRLGLKLLQLGVTVLHNMDLQTEARPLVEALGTLTGETVHLCVFDGERMVFVERAAGGRTGATNATITMELSPCHCTGVGKAALAFQDEAAIRRVIAAGLTGFTDSTLTEPAALLAALAGIRTSSYALDMSEHRQGVHCVAAPIRAANGRVIAAISVSGEAARLPAERLHRLAPYVISHAAAISRRLGFAGDETTPRP
ncbi:IclR family transcriptional regulator [Acuticoccus sp. MNP-M23]|uniref:IclR family transcriptional regulator n=1 Tax=Acuticoccus sp. MNP-M23 TaxID=3072793 RepID=UPI002815484B|nr:IclR family transcriptional regulator [Acuticoccus sp. MNP-M23]WMS44651.1 IclR family transcriptional regulator [Acuticoccus sp. MNP-M23]